MVTKNEIQAFYEEYKIRVEDLYHHYDKTMDIVEKQKLFHELEGMVYILSMLRDRFELIPDINTELQKRS